MKHLTISHLTITRKSPDVGDGLSVTLGARECPKSDVDFCLWHTNTCPFFVRAAGSQVSCTFDEEE